MRFEVVAMHGVSSGVGVFGLSRSGFCQTPGQSEIDPKANPLIRPSATFSALPGGERTAHEFLTPLFAN